MNTKQVIQSSANVIRITNIRAGDVYKRFDESYDDRIYYGVVKNVHNDGEKTIIESTEYRWNGYSTLEVEMKILRGEKDYILFPATVGELNLDLEKARHNKAQAIETWKQNMEKAEHEIKEIDSLISGERMKELTDMSYKELSQSEYNEKKALAI